MMTMFTTDSFRPVLTGRAFFGKLRIPCGLFFQPAQLGNGEPGKNALAGLFRTAKSIPTRHSHCLHGVEWRALTLDANLRSARFQGTCFFNLFSDVVHLDAGHARLRQTLFRYCSEFREHLARLLRLLGPNVQYACFGTLQQNQRRSVSLGNLRTFRVLKVLFAVRTMYSQSPCAQTGSGIGGSEWESFPA